MPGPCPDANSRHQTVLLDALGRKTALPDAVRRNGEYLDGGLITYYALDDDHERVWGLWDIRKNAPALALARRHRKVRGRLGPRAIRRPLGRDRPRRQMAHQARL